MKKPFLCLIGIHKIRFVDRDIEEDVYITFRVCEECVRCGRVLATYGSKAIPKVPKK